MRLSAVKSKFIVLNRSYVPVTNIRHGLARLQGPSARQAARAVSLPPDANEVRRRVERQLGAGATAEMVESVVRRVMDLLDKPGEDQSTAPRPAPPESNDDGGERLIIAVFGVNQPGIVAQVSQILSRHSCNILDISQKLMQEFFTMILVVDLTGADATFEQLQQEFDQLGDSLGIKIYAQHEAVFRALNRL